MSVLQTRPSSSIPGEHHDGCTQLHKKQPGNGDKTLRALHDAVLRLVANRSAGHSPSPCDRYAHLLPARIGWLACQSISHEAGGTRLSRQTAQAPQRATKGFPATRLPLPPSFARPAPQAARRPAPSWARQRPGWSGRPKEAAERRRGLAGSEGAGEGEGESVGTDE